MAYEDSKYNQRSVIMAKQDETALDKIDDVLSNKKKFRRLLIVLLIMAIVLCVGFYTGAISFNWGQSSPKIEHQRD